MGSPSTAITRTDASMTYQEFSLAANQRKMIGLQVLPPIGVAQEASDFPKLEIASLLTEPRDTKRAPYGGYAREGWNWTTDSYNCNEHGVEEIADDAMIERYGDLVRVEQIAIGRAINRILQRLEYDIAQAVFNTTTWTGATLTTAISTAWTTAASADPIADVDGAREKVITSCGQAPNTVVMTDYDFIYCLRTDRIESLLKYDASQVLMAMNQRGGDMQLVNSAAQALAGLFQVDKVLIGQGVYNASDPGIAASFSRFWSTGYVMVCNTNDDGMNGDLEAAAPNIGRTIFSTKNGEPLPGSDDPGFGSLVFDEYRDEPVRGSVFRPRNKRDVKILHAEAGHLLSGAS